jgi:hypothetical protein
MCNIFCLPIPFLIFLDFVVSAFLAACFGGALRNPADFGQYFGPITDKEILEELREIKERKEHPGKEVVIYLCIFAVLFVFIALIECVGLYRIGRL